MQTPRDTSQDLPESRSFHRGTVLVLSLCHLVHDIYSGFLSPLLPLLIQKLSLSLTRAGLLSTVMQLPSLLNPFIGVLADRVSVKGFIVLAPAVTAVTMSLIGVAPTYGVLLILLGLAGISVAVFHVPAPVLVANFSGDQKGMGMSWFMVGGELARTLGPMAAVGAVSLLGLEGFYPVMGFGLLASLWLFFHLKDVPMNTPVKKDVSLVRTWQKMRHVLLPLTGILVARGFMHACMTPFLPTFIKIHTGDLWLAGISLTLLESAGVGGVLLSGILSDRLGRRKILFASMVGAPLALVLVSVLDGWLRLVSVVVMGFTLLSTTPVMLALVQEHSTSSPAAANGFFMMVSFTARSAVTVGVGFIADGIGLQATYLVSAVLGLAGLPFIWMLPKRR